jgi:DNA-binding NarL/FixJ family response regulator
MTSQMGEGRLRVLICDKHLVVRNGLRTLLEAEPDIEVVESTDSGLHAVVLARSTRLDVVITGLELRSSPGIELVQQLSELPDGHAPGVIVFGMNDTDESVADILHAGASGLLSSDAGREDLVSAVRAVAGGQAMLAPTVAQRLVDWFRRRDVQSEVSLRGVVATLTPREREVLLLIARGMQPEEVARKLCIGVATVRTHIYRLRSKLDLRDRAQLVSFAFRAGLIQPAPSQRAAGLVGAGVPLS